MPQKPETSQDQLISFKNGTTFAIIFHSFFFEFEIQLLDSLSRIDLLI